MVKSRKMIRKIISDFYMVLILIFLYAPILTMMVLSFNQSKSRARWGGFTLDWYLQMFDSRSIMSALSTTLIIAFGVSLGFKTVLIAHITFNIPYVILSVMPKLKQTDKSTYEAALDLGATPLQAFFKVVFPDILPGVLSGFLLSFTMSLDDFIITHFTKGAGINTLSTLIYSEVRRGIKPSMYALSTVIFLTVLILLLIVNFRSFKKKD